MENEKRIAAIESMADYIEERMNVLKLNALMLDFGEDVTYSKYVGERQAYHITPKMVVRKTDGSLVIRANETEEREDGYMRIDDEVELPLNGCNEFQFQILSDIINEMDSVYGRYFLIGFLCYDGSFSPIIKGRKSLMFEDYNHAEEYMKKIQSKYKHRLEIKRM